MSKKAIKSGRPPVHPGRILKSGFIETYNIRIETIANILGLKRVQMSRILNGNAPITIELAIKLEALTGTEVGHWMTMQSKYDQYQVNSVDLYATYLEMLSSFSKKAISMPKNERRKDTKTREMVDELAILAGSAKNQLKKAS